ncbi:MAG: peptidylprolyl isomerase [Kiritimatiellae bacterium]|nr:peptidylprolyl isomerase [Kiritimatiellia bacterium]
MSITRATCLLSLAALFASAGCGKQSESRPEKSAPKPTPMSGISNPEPPAEPTRDPREVVARVDDITLTWADMEHRAKALYVEESRTMLIPEGRATEAMNFFRRRAISIFVFKTVMLEEARKKQIALTEADRRDGTNRMAKTVMRQRGVSLEQFCKESPFGEEAAWREIEDGIVVDKLLKQEVDPNVTVAGTEVDALAARIIKDRADKHAKIEELRAKLLAGADFAKMASEYSDCPSKRNGGDLGQVTRGRMVAVFDQAAFTQPIGEIGPIVETSAGFHIVKVTARHAAQPAKDGAPAVPETAQVSHILIKTRPVLTGPKLAAEVRREKYTKAVQDYYAKLKQGRRIECIYKDMVF